MTAFSPLRLPVDSRDGPATIVTHATAFARTLGTRGHGAPTRGDEDGALATEPVPERAPGIEDAGSRSPQTLGAPAGATRPAIPPCYTLAACADRLAASEGIDLLELDPMTTVVVHTAHSAYRIVVLQDTTILLQGGRCFPEVTLAHLRGSGFGGHLLKLAWIGVGLRMEFQVERKRFVTSPVRTITIEADPAPDRPR